MSFGILGMGTAVPDNRLSQQDGLELTRKLCCSTPQQEAWLPAIYQHSGINTRHFAIERQVMDDVLDGTAHSGSPFVPTESGDRTGPSTAERIREYTRLSGPLVQTAALRALERAQVPPEQITHLVTVSCTGARAPGVDIGLIKALGLPASTQRTHVGFMGCHGALNGLRVARAFTGSEPRARVLLCAVELCSLHYYYGWDPQKVVINSLFADGAAAVVGAAMRRPTSSAMRSQTWQLSASGSCVFPDSEDAMSWSVGDSGFVMTLSRHVPELIASNLPAWLHGWLAQHELSLQDVASWAVHPGGAKILTAVEESLRLPAGANDVARQVLADYGNMSSPTVLFLLDALQKRNAPRPCVALAFGPGLTVEAALFR